MTVCVGVCVFPSVYLFVIVCQIEEESERSEGENEELLDLNVRCFETERLRGDFWFYGFGDLDRLDLEFYFSSFSLTGLCTAVCVFLIYGLASNVWN